MSTRSRCGAVRLAYAAYAALLFLALGLTAVLTVTLTPGLERRRRLTRRLARLFLRLAGMPLLVHGVETLPEGQCVVVANHASYLDGVVLMAALPARFGFVIKREMAKVPLAAALLRRIGSEFVERFAPGKTAADARRVLRAALRGHSLVFFPEGTFSREPGLLRFHAGAFIAAVHAGCPVVPAVIHGTRAALPPGSALPAPVAITVELLPPLPAAATDDEAASAQLRASARAAILERLLHVAAVAPADGVQGMGDLPE